jgi:glycosyltransferase involved in cell wall biosynthesis
VSLYVDVSAAVHARAGLGRYAESLARALLEAAPGRVRLFYNQDSEVRPLEGLEQVPTRRIRMGYKPWRMAVWLAHRVGLGFDRLVPDAELFHSTEHLLMPLRTVPAVLTVHDLIYKLFPQHHKRLNYWYLNAAMPLYCQRANAIIVISKSTRRDLVQHYGVDPSKVHVVYEAAAPSFQRMPAEKAAALVRPLGLPERYALHVGTIEPRKNLTRLVEALEMLRLRGIVIPLVVVGGKGWLYEGFFARLEQLEMRRYVHFAGYVTDTQLPALYAAATMTVMPSVYEGFGLPVVESMASGTPVVCSDASSLPELGGGAARYHDPLDTEAMARALAVVWQDAELRAEMRRQGVAQAATFSWQRAAQETLAVYEHVLGPTYTMAGT